MLPAHTSARAAERERNASPADSACVAMTAPSASSSARASDDKPQRAVLRCAGCEAGHRAQLLGADRK
jgi:hypothetical protein